MQPVQSRRVQASIDEVWSVVANGWMYSGWVVGASRIRDVDFTFPAAGSNLHQSVGIWPLLIDDVTTVVSVEPRRSLVLQVRSRPWGEGRVRLRLVEQGPHTVIEIDEEITRGLGRWLPRSAQVPLMNWRNRECLDRLAHLAERGAAEATPASSAAAAG